MFWIHGGSFTFGQSGPAMYGSDFFMDKDIVLVTANYRLGILGFISTEDDVIPGNFGLKDQVLALRWVKENIEQFGGDPNRVTIFGQSAGSVSTGYHFLSPLSKGLFHKAILESGAPLVPWSVSAPGIARQRAKKVANLVGCNSDISNDMLKCLRSINASNLVTQYSKFYEFVNNPEVAFPPTVENCGPNAFICINPLVEFKPVTQVPVIMGLNSAEGGVGIANLCNDTELSYPEFITDFNRVISIMLMYENIALSEDIDNIGKQLLYKYFPKGINNQSLLEAVQLFGDGVILYGVMDMVAKLNSSVYFYLFDHQNEFSFNTQFGPCKKYLGVTHEDEVTLLFRTSFYKNRTLNDDDTKVSKTMINIWTRFASTDIPTIDGQSNGKSWPKFTTMEDSLILLINSSRPKIIKNPLVEKYRFWQKLPHISHLGYINYTFNRYF
ncbi:juvenile hormone esterase-like isoform X2 [Daktulosphaira vitifoliae]|nr:juvenile hormone esterase-like isoform X2 [Daktulosphaira vitifoliae]